MNKSNAFLSITIVALAVAVFIFISYVDEVSHQNSAIQHQRVRSIELTCEEQNERNERTVKTLNQLFSQQKATTSEQKNQEEAAKASTILIINALAPVENCKLRVRKLAP